MGEVTNVDIENWRKHYLAKKYESMTGEGFFVMSCLDTIETLRAELARVTIERDYICNSAERDLISEIERLRNFAKGSGMVSEAGDLVEVSLLVCGLHDQLERVTAERDALLDLQKKHVKRDEANRWIPVGERYPHVDKFVSDYVQICSIGIYEPITYAGEACYVPKAWIADDYTYPCGWYRHNHGLPEESLVVTHWRQLPEPPQETATGAGDVDGA